MGKKIDEADYGLSGKAIAILVSVPIAWGDGKTTSKWRRILLTAWKNPD